LPKTGPPQEGDLTNHSPADRPARAKMEIVTNAGAVWFKNVNKAKMVVKSTAGTAAKMVVFKRKDGA